MDQTGGHHPVGPQIGDRRAGEGDGAWARGDQAGNGLEQRRLAVAVGADDRQELALRNGERQPVEDARPP